MSKTKDNVTNLRTADTASAVVYAIQHTELNTLYTVAFNENVDKSNRVAIFNETAESAKAVCDAFKLQQDFMQAVARCTVWLDADNVVIYVGAVFTVFAQQALKADKKAYEEFSKLFNDSLDKKYNERKLKNKTITALTETRHKFDSVDSFTEFITAFAKAVNTYKTAQQTAESTADSTAQQKADSKQKAKADNKQKADSKQTKDSNKQTKDSKQKAKVK
jgi:hypothetical protein